MRAGVLLAIIDSFRGIFPTVYQAVNIYMTSSHLFLNRKKEDKCDEISGKPVSVIFDGNTHVCEAMAISGTTCRH